VGSFELIARYVEALGGRLDLVADFGDRTVRLPVSEDKRLVAITLLESILVDPEGETVADRLSVAWRF
jgi:hypothetical protein